MTHPSRRTRMPPLRAACAALLCVICLSPLSPLQAADAGARRPFDIPAGSATTTLKQFAQQAGVELLYSTDAIAGAKTNAVSGELAPLDALTRMLAGSELILSEGKTNRAIAVTRAPGPNVQRAAQTATSDRPNQNNAPSGPVVTMDSLEVTGSRMRLNSGEQPMQPVFTLTARDIERTGASSLGQLFQYIPAITSSSSGLMIDQTNGGSLGGSVSGTSARTTAQLRGGAESATLLLVDGKRVARTQQQNAGGVGFDLGGIPLSAIERVEVLLDGASAIYGSDAINGVINVILKKRFAGTEFRFTYDNTFDKDAGYRTASLTHGFARGKWSGLVTLSASDNNIMLLADRKLTSTFNRQLLGGSATDPFAIFYAEGTGTVARSSGILPGLTSIRASIPVGATGQNLTIADFANAPVPILGIGVQRQGAMGYAKKKSGYARLTYEFSDWLQVTSSARMGEQKSIDNGRYRRALNITLPADYPGNPFGVPVLFNKYFWDLPLMYARTNTRNDEFALSASGKLPGDWHYEVGMNYLRGTNDSLPQLLAGAGGKAGSFQLSAASLNAAIAAGRRPLLLYDSMTQSPNPTNSLDELFVITPTLASDLNQIWSYTAQADGKVLTLPAGDIRAVAGSEFREEYVSFPHASGLAVWPAIPNRKVSAFFAEVRVPLVAPKQLWPLLHQLDLNLAGRTENYTQFGRTTTPRIGMAWRPVAPLLLRASFGQGFLVPNLYNITPPLSQNTANWVAASTPVDPLRGNQSYLGQPYTLLNGGNPGLKPQRSKNLTYGAILEVPKIKGLSISFGYFDNKYTNRFDTIQSLSDRILYAPQTVFRGPNVAGDAVGWPGPVTGIDARTINIARAHVTGYDFGLRWNRSTPLGDLTLNISGEKILRDEQQLLPNSPPLTSVDKRFDPMRITNSLFWSRGAVEAGVTSIYGGRYYRVSSNEAFSPSRWTDSVMRWDFNTSYDFGRVRGFGSQGSSWLKRALRDTKWSVTIVDAFNTEPPLDAQGNFKTTVIDIRLRRYVIDFTKRL